LRRQSSARGVGRGRQHHRAGDGRCVQSVDELEASEDAVDLIAVHLAVDPKAGPIAAAAQPDEGDANPGARRHRAERDTAAEARAARGCGERHIEVLHRDLP
jgi:hypothetical protein